VRERKGAAHYKVARPIATFCRGLRKNGEPIEMRFGRGLRWV